MKRGTPDHPKMMMLASILGIEKWAAVGIMESVWHFTAKYAPAGDIGKYTDEMIAVGIGYMGDAKTLIKSLVDSQWLDISGQVRLYVHDWHDHSDDYANKYLLRHSLPYANGCCARKKEPKEPKQPEKKSKRRTSPDKSRVSVSESESESVSVSHSSEGDSAHLILKTSEVLRGITWEQDVVARQKAGVTLTDPRLEEWAGVAVGDALLMGELDHPATWWRKFLHGRLNQSASSTVVEKKELPPPPLCKPNQPPRY